MTAFKWVQVLLSGSVLCYASMAQANSSNSLADQKRAEKVAELLIAVFAQNPNDPNRLNIQFGAAIAGVSESEAAKNLSNNGQKAIPSPAAMMKEMLSAEFNAEEMRLVGPVIDRQLVAQSNIIKSCKISGKISQPSPTRYNFPVTCQIPNIDWDTVKKPAVNEQDGNAKNFALMMNWMVDLISKAPKQGLNTVIQIDQHGNNLVPEMDNENFFPASVTTQIMGLSAADVEE